MLRGSALLTTMIVMAGCTSPGVSSPGHDVTAESYRTDTTKGLVVLSALWGRSWKCGKFENGQLRSFGFDRLPSVTTADVATADVVIEDSTYVGGGPATNYVLALDPGEYGLAMFAIRVAFSTTDVRTVSVGRARLFEGGKPVGGTFTVQAGELVYIGHFGLDCYKEPKIWRYYLEGRGGFEHYKRLIKNQYPFLPVETMQMRLFKTSALGRDYVLPP
ncbi:MAG TPA: hypothetical protein VFR82_00180 [Nitrospira sp.]|nr:hypothetical protein [Nitrospira sp.]